MWTHDQSGAPVTRSDLRSAVAAGLVAGLVALVLLLTTGSWGDLTPRFDTNYLLGFVGSFVVGTLLTVGLPVTLYLRYRLRTPIVVLIGNLGFWLVIAGGGDAPGWFFAMATWPISVVAYCLVGVVERWLRRRQRNGVATT